MSEPRNVYYPQLVTRITLRFDESLSFADARAAAALGAPPLPDVSAAAGTPLASFAAARSAAAGVQPGYVSQSILPPGPPAVFGGLEASPRRGSVEMPGVRQAGKFSFEYSFRDLPIDPRLLRGARVEIYLASLLAADFARGVVASTPESRTSSYLPTRNAGGLPADSLLFVGSVDEFDGDHDEKSSTTKIEGRDATAIFLDAKIPLETLRTIKFDRSIVEIVQQIVDIGQLGSTVDIVVEGDSSEWEAGFIPSPGNSINLNRSRMGADGATPQSTPSSDKLSYWDVITKYCFLVGAVPFVRVLTQADLASRTIVFGSPTRKVSAGQLVLSIRRARNLLDQQKGPTPFKGAQPRKLDAPLIAADHAPQTIKVRRLVYGRELLKVRFTHKFRGKVTPRVRCVGIDENARGEDKSIFGVWPPLDSTADQMKFEDQEIIIPVYGVRSPGALTQLARDLHEEIGKGEMGGSATTKWLTSFGGDNADADMLRLRPADAVELLVDVRQLASRAPLMAALVEDNRRPFEAQVAEVAARIGSVSTARLLVAYARGMVAQTLNFFRISTVKYDWDVEKGVSVTFDFQNYVVERNAPAQLQAPAATSPAVNTKVSSRASNKPAKPVAPTAPPQSAPRVTDIGSVLVNDELKLGITPPGGVGAGDTSNDFNSGVGG